MIVSFPYSLFFCYCHEKIASVLGFVLPFNRNVVHHERRKSFTNVCPFVDKMWCVYTLDTLFIQFHYFLTFWYSSASSPFPPLLLAPLSTPDLRVTTNIQICWPYTVLSFPISTLFCAFLVHVTFYYQKINFADFVSFQSTAILIPYYCPFTSTHKSW